MACVTDTKTLHEDASTPDKMVDSFTRKMGIAMRTGLLEKVSVSRPDIDASRNVSRRSTRNVDGSSSDTNSEDNNPSSRMALASVQEQVGQLQRQQAQQLALLQQIASALKLPAQGEGGVGLKRAVSEGRYYSPVSSPRGSSIPLPPSSPRAVMNTLERTRSQALINDTTK
eukprot:jgi/Chlat1/3301/Chrsp22S03543